ncbi:hypothetical protein [Noviherbaspirillum cavernae]|nr:hypothetical protein [Noviherbaspirillum cavernae]
MNLSSKELDREAMCTVGGGMAIGSFAQYRFVQAFPQPMAPGDPILPAVTIEQSMPTVR